MLVVAAVMVWCGLAVVDRGVILGSPAPFRPVPVAWPAATNLPRADAKPTILMFVRADDRGAPARLAELGKIVTSLPHPPFVAVVQVGTETPTAVWDAAGRIPRTARLLDKAGVEARRFGAVVTGQVVVYDADGTLVFSGTSNAQLRAALR